MAPTMRSRVLRGRVAIRYKGQELSARPFHKDRRVTQAAIVGNKLLGATLTQIRERQQSTEDVALRAAKTKREQRLLHKRRPST